MINNLIKTVAEAGLTQMVYYGFHALALISLSVLGCWIGQKKEIGLAKSSLIILIVYPLSYLWMLIMFWIESGFTSFGGQHIVTIFIYVPFICMLAAKILKLNWNDVCDIVAPLLSLNHAVAHWGCMFPGCCGGYPAEFGLYNTRTASYYFPIQPIEAIIAGVIVWILIVRIKKQNFRTDGKTYPIMLALFGSTRFICEFYRDNAKIWMNCSALSFHALFMCVVGLIWLFVLRQKEKKAQSAEA